MIAEGIGLQDWHAELCPECQDEEDAQARVAGAAGRSRRRRRMAGIPDKLLEVRLRDLTSWSPELLFHANAWAQSGGGLYVWSPVNGNGKTTLAAAAANALLARRHVDWVEATEFVGAAADDFDSTEYKDAHRLMQARTPIVIDDLGQEPHTPAAARDMRRLIMRRLDADVPLLITSNLSLDDIAQDRPHYGTWLASRLAGYCVQVEVADQVDHRIGR